MSIEMEAAVGAPLLVQWLQFIPEAPPAGQRNHPWYPSRTLPLTVDGSAARAGRPAPYHNTRRTIVGAANADLRSLGCLSRFARTHPECNRVPSRRATFGPSLPKIPAREHTGPKRVFGEIATELNIAKTMVARI